jgi:hypothetical protein
MSDFLEDLLDVAKENNFQSLYDIVFHSPHYPGLYTFTCLFICVCLRFSAGVGGLQWWRSYALGFLFSYAQRYALRLLISRILYEKIPDTLIHYSIIWSLINLCPFDLLYRLFYRPIPRLICALLGEFAAGHALVDSLWFACYVFPERPWEALVRTMVSYAVPFAIDIFDNAVFTPKRKGMLRPWPYLKRLLVIATVCIIISQETFVLGKGRRVMDLYVLLSWVACMGALLKMVDALIASSPFDVVDFVFPTSVTKHIGKYYPNRAPTDEQSSAPVAAAAAAQ